MDTSIVIATRNRRALLERTLQSLVRATGAAFETEVVIADHDSTDGTADLLDQWSSRLPLVIVPVPFRHESIADPKNAGASAACGDVLIFVDSGMVCPPHFVASHLAAQRNHRGATVAGAIFGWDVEDDDAEFWSRMDVEQPPENLPTVLEDPRSRYLDQSSRAPWMLAWGANLSVPRVAFLECGGYDTQMRGWGWDDIELAFRLTGAGVPVQYAPEPWAVHWPHPRASLAERLVSARANWMTAYLRHRSPDLETWESCDYWHHGRCLELLESLSLRIGAVPPRRSPSTGARVLFGFQPASQVEPGDIFVVPPAALGTDGVRSYGLRTWLPDAGADVALVAGSMITLYDRCVSSGWPPLALGLLAEAARVARRVEVVPDADAALADNQRIRDLASAAGVALYVRADLRSCGL